MVSINIKRKNKMNLNLVLDQRNNSYISEQFRTIRTNMYFSTINQKLKTIVITSARKEAGKSFTAANLAVTMAKENKRVLLVDADLRRPSVHHTFKLNNIIGLTTLLAEYNLPTSKVVNYNTQYKLYILTSGPVPPNPSELLSSDRMADVMRMLESEYDFIIYDMPPILSVTDAQLIANRVDGTVFVMPKGQITQDEAIKSKELLEIAGANVIGAIFNKAGKKSPDYYYDTQRDKYGD